MSSPAKRWQSIRKDQDREIGLLQVDIGPHGKQLDHVTDLLLKQAKDALKDALVESAERHDCKLFSWEHDCGMFMFPIEGPNSFNNCCLAAMEMLEQLPSVKREAQLSAQLELERLIMVRIFCDTGKFTYDPESHHPEGHFVEKLKKHMQVVSVENKATITERVFRQLKSNFKSRFEKWKHSPELGVDLYAAVAGSVEVGSNLEELLTEQPTLEENHPSDENPVPSSIRKHSLAQRSQQAMPEILKSRKMLSIGAVVLLLLCLYGFIHFSARPTATPPATAPQPSPWAELVQSAEWRDWRKQIHEKLSVDKVTEKTLTQAMNVKLPARPENAAGALRRDLAIADVLMNYPDVKDILWKRFGIDEHNFLGAGLSQPSSAASIYEAASVHEYLIKNRFADHSAVWTRKLDPIKDEINMTVAKLFDNDPKLKTDPEKAELVKKITQRVKEKHTAIPAVIRFARLNAVDYSHKLGRLDRYYVFASNLAEVWNESVQDAAILSGHTLKKDGDTLYVWVFLPSNPAEVIPATWGEVLKHLPMWLGEADKN